MSRFLVSLDRAQALLWRVGIRFQWPCWLLDRAWSRQATPYVPTPREQLEAMPPWLSDLASVTR